MINKSNNAPLILAIDTSCDETSVAVTKGTKSLSNIVWSQAEIHAKFGGVVPSTARTGHEKMIESVMVRALGIAKVSINQIEGVAVTVGPGLAIALGVGIQKAKEISQELKVPLIPVNHLEAHVISPLVTSNAKYSIKKFKTKIFPSYGLVISGGNTLFVQIDEIGKYKVLAETHDDAIGEALDKGARLLGLGYPGGAILEKFAEKGNKHKYELPIPLIGQEKLRFFSYSGLKTAFLKVVEKEKSSTKGLTKQKIYNLAASYQNTAFNHLIRIMDFIIREDYDKPLPYLFVGGGVAANIVVKQRIRSMCKVKRITPLFPFSPTLFTDNAAMIGVNAYYNFQKGITISPKKIDRIANLKIGDKLK
jgi:N6-L-threonylcarbamoyladenine synthase